MYAIRSYYGLPVIWLELQDCAGNSEALIRSDGPKIDEIVLDVISLEFHETLMAPSGFQAEKQLDEAIEHFKGKYLVFVEGSIPVGAGKDWCTIGASGENFVDHLNRVVEHSAAVVAVGACVITSYSIHYTKLYEAAAWRSEGHFAASATGAGLRQAALPRSGAGIQAPFSGPRCLSVS